MKTQLEKKLEKLPYKVTKEVDYLLNVTKVRDCIDKETLWCITYSDLYGNNLIVSIHKSLQACVDNTLNTLKTL